MTRPPRPNEGRPPIGPRRDIRFPVDVWARVEAEAAAIGIAPPEYVRRAVVRELGGLEVCTSCPSPASCAGRGDCAMDPE